MSTKTSIAWTDATWNPIRGCSRVSEGCRNCYAETVAARFSGPGQPYEGLAKKVGGEARWTGEVRFIPASLADPLHWRRPRRIFVNSMSDLFHEKVSDAWLDQIFAVMLLAPRHTFQILTKRPERMRAYCSSNNTLGRVLAYATSVATLKGSIGWKNDGLPGFQLPNVHLGVSVENQQAADERIPLLLQTPAAVRWISAEPLLGPINFRWTPYCHQATGESYRAYLERKGSMDHLESLRLLDWVVVGGESGRRYRAMELEWMAQIACQCRDADVPVFIKQDSGTRSGMQGRIPDQLWNLKQFPKGL